MTFGYAELDVRFITVVVSLLRKKMIKKIFTLFQKMAITKAVLLRQLVHLYGYNIYTCCAEALRLHPQALSASYRPWRLYTAGYACKQSPTEYSSPVLNSAETVKDSPT